MNAVTSVNTGMNSLLKSSRFVPSQTALVRPFGIVTEPATLEEIVLHYYPFNIGNYRRRTGHLTLIEHAIYRSLLDTYYLQEKPLCADDAELMRTHCVRTETEVQAFKNVVKDFFDLRGDGYHHPDCDEKIAAYQEKSEKARESAHKRWNRNANAMRRQCEGNANQEPRTKNQEPLTNNKDLSADTDDPVQPIFDYWCSVMKKNGSAKLTAKRKSCIKARIKEGYTVDQIKQAVDGCSKSSYHMGQNDAGTVYDDLTLICRSGEKIEYFINNIGKHLPAAGNGKPEESFVRSTRERSLEEDLNDRTWAE